MASATKAPPPPPTSGITVKVVLAPKMYALLQKEPKLFPTGSEFVEVVTGILKEYKTFAAENKIDAYSEHFVPRLSLHGTVADIDLDEVLAADEINSQRRQTPSFDSPSPPKDQPLLEPKSKNFMFDFNYGDIDIEQFDEFPWADYEYKIDGEYHEGFESDTPSDDVQLYHDVLRFWGNHENRPAFISRSRMDNCFKTIKEKFTGVDAIVNEISDFVFLPHAEAPSERVEDDDLPRALLLHGPPGTGKTTMIRSILENIGVFTVWVGTAAELKRPYIGQTEKAIKYLFDMCKKNPHVLCAIFWDEIDNVTEARGNKQADHKSGELRERGRLRRLNCTNDLLS